MLNHNNNKFSFRINFMACLSVGGLPGDRLLPRRENMDQQMEHWLPATRSHTESGITIALCSKIWGHADITIFLNCL